MSTSASASGVRVRTARATSAAASRSQVPALSNPVLESMRDAFTSWLCRRERCSSVTNGRANTMVSALMATASVTRTATHSSATSFCTTSRVSRSSLKRVVGSEPLTAGSRRIRFAAHWEIPASATTSIQSEPGKPGVGDRLRLGPTV